MLQAEVPENQVLQAEALLRHRLLVLLGPNHLLCFGRLCCPDHLLRSAALLLHGFGLVLLGSRRLLLGPGCILLCSGRNLLRPASNLLHTGCHVLLGSGCKLLRPVGLISAREQAIDCPTRPGSRFSGGPVIFLCGLKSTQRG
jgi:hypothetical protein